MDNKEVRKMQSDLLDKIKHRVASDTQFRDAFFAHPEEALSKSDLATEADALSKVMPLRPPKCTWTCPWTAS